MPVVAINKQTGALEGVPDIITRGFVMERQPGAARRRRAPAGRGHRAGERRGAHRSGADQGEAARRAAAVLPQAFGPAAVRAARHHGDLTREWIDRFAPGQRVRRRRAVCRRAHLDHLARQLRADRPGLVLQHRRARRAGEFRRPRRRVPRRAVVPAVRLRVVPDPGGPGRRRLALLLVPHARRRRHEGDRRRRCSSRCISAFLSLVFGTLDVSGKPFRAGGYVGEWLAQRAVRVPESHRLDHRRS